MVSCLLDVLALAALDLAVGDPGRAALVAPLPVPTCDTHDGRLDAGYLLGITAVNGDEMAGEVMLAAEGAATRLVVASVRLQPVRVVRLNVRLQIVGARKRCVGTLSAIKSRAETITDMIRTSRACGALILPLGILAQRARDATLRLRRGALGGHDGRRLDGLSVRQLGRHIGGRHGRLRHGLWVL